MGPPREMPADREGVQALSVGGGDQLIRELVDVERSFGSSRRARTREVDPDDGVIRREPVKDRSELTLDAAIRAMGEHQAGTGTTDRTSQNRFRQNGFPHLHAPPVRSGAVWLQKRYDPTRVAAVRTRVPGIWRSPIPRWNSLKAAERDSGSRSPSLTTM